LKHEDYYYYYLNSRLKSSFSNNLLPLSLSTHVQHTLPWPWLCYGAIEIVLLLVENDDATLRTVVEIILLFLILNIQYTRFYIANKWPQDQTFCNNEFLLWEPSQQWTMLTLEIS